MKHEKITLTDKQIADLPSTSVELVPAVEDFKIVLRGPDPASGQFDYDLVQDEDQKSTPTGL